MSGKKSSSSSSSHKSSSSPSSSSPSLLTVVLDVSPLTWQERALKRTALDRKRLAEGRRSIGPAALDEALAALQAFLLAAGSLERNAALAVVAVADNESAVVHPRADRLQEWLSSGGGSGSSSGSSSAGETDPRQLQQDLLAGVAQVTARAAAKAPLHRDPAHRQGAMAAALSKALCLINRFLVAAQTGTGISALQQTANGHYLDRVDDEGVVALMGKNKHGGGAGGKRNKDGGGTHRSSSAWSPRVLLIQASDDRSRDYNAFMNCAFAAAKQRVVLDGCFLTAGGGGGAGAGAAAATSSSFLEQAVDLTGGVFLAPAGAAQVAGALTEVLTTVFLAPLPCRHKLHLPALHKVDFRARCFATGTTVDKAFVCNQCLSIFQSMPTAADGTAHCCPTCRADIVR